MRPTAAVTGVRLDTVISGFDGGSSATTILQGSYAVLPELAIGARLVGNTLSFGDVGTTAFANPALFALWAPAWNLPVQLGFFGAVALPLGQGGGTNPDADVAATVGAGVQNRSGMDNALFQPNYFTIIGGIGASWRKGPITVGAEATVLQLMRVRDVSSDDSRTNLTSGLHLGWAFWGPLAVSTELHYQRWLSTPAAVSMVSARREQATWLFGLRATFKVGSVKMRPGISYSFPLDAPMNDAGYHLVQIDLPFVF